MAKIHPTEQGHRLASWVSWILLGLTLLAIPGVLVLQQMGCGNLLNPSAAEPARAYGLLALPLHALAFARVGTLINTFRPDNRFGWLASGYGFALMWLTLIGSYGECAIIGRAALPGGEYAIWLNNLMENLVFLSLAFMPWLFPDGHFLSSRWKRIGLIGSTLVLLLTGFNAFWPAPLRVDPLGRNWIDNPLGFSISPAPWLDQVISRTGDGGDIVIVIFLAGIISLVLRWRRSVGETRQQLKWLTYHLATSGTLFMAVEILGSAFYPAIFNGWFYLFVLLLFWIGLPVVIGLAIFKYRLYDIDIIFRRTVVYALLTAILALVSPSVF